MSLPFSTTQFLDVFQKYNTAVFPAQSILLALGVLIIVLIYVKSRQKNKMINVLLGLLWLWNGIAYHLVFFTQINKAAFGFAVVFVIQGILFLIAAFKRKNIQYEKGKSIRQYIGLTLILFALFIYPLFGLIQGHGVQRIIMIGLPCPTVIFTFGVFMFVVGKFPLHLLIFPTLWAIIGFTAAWNFGIKQDTALIITALMVDLWIIFDKAKKLERTSSFGT